MPRNHVPPEKRIQPGQTRNPKGSSDKARSLGKLRRLTNEQVSEIGTLVLEGNRQALVDIKNDKDATVLQVWMADLIVASMRKGDPAAFRAILDRICGKPRESIAISGDDKQPLHIRVMTDEEKIARADALAAARRVTGDD